jgi:hypothetical protein
MRLFVTLTLLALAVGGPLAGCTALTACALPGLLCLERALLEDPAND